MPEPLPRMSQRGLFAPGRCFIPLPRVVSGVGGRIIRSGAGAALLIGACCSLAACAGSSTPLPDLRRSSAPSLSQQERKDAMEALSRKGNTHADEAVREIEDSE